MSNAENVLENRARNAVESVGYKVESVSLMTEGQSHHNFTIIPALGPTMIARFEKSEIITSTNGVRRDLHFNGILSIARERALIDLVRDQAELPAPKVYGFYQTEQDTFLLTEKLPGIHWKSYLDQTNYTYEAFIRSLRFLGRDLAKAHKIHFGSYGDVMDENTIYPGNICSFSDRIRMTTELQIEGAAHSRAFEEKELNLVSRYLNTELDAVKRISQDPEQKSTLVLTDLHPTNFLVDDQGKPSAYFDLEFCQAAHPSLEFYVLRLALFNYFETTFTQAEESFFQGYKESGGIYDIQDPLNIKLEHLLALKHLITCVTAYKNASDDIRNTWSKQFKGILFEAIANKQVDYLAIADVWRSKTKQPKYPTAL